MKEIIRIAGIKEADYSYSSIVKEGNLLFLTSQLSCNLRTGKLIPGTIEEQTKRALENLQFILEHANSSLDHILRVRIYMRDVSEFEKMEKVYRTFFEHGSEPARVTIQAPSPLNGVDIEIEATAVIDNPQ